MNNLARKAVRVHRSPLVRGGQGRRAQEVEELAIFATRLIAALIVGYILAGLTLRW